MQDKLPEAAHELLEFWFGHHGSPVWNTERREWFTKSAAFDDVIRSRFLTLWETAHSGDPDDGEDWCATHEGACARVVLLDQFPRNLFRNDPRSFATDAQALALARRIVEGGMDRELPTGFHRMFCYLPFEHSESLQDQNESVRLTTQLREETAGKVDVVEWAEKHRVVIARFGRFPHRNAILGRQSTPEELAFLKEPGSTF